MNYMQNLHTHTTYVDGKDTPEEMILAAISRGFDSIGFSEHTYNAYSNYPRQLTVDKMQDYYREIMALKSKYQSKISVFCGLEYELFSDVPTDNYDYLIGSVHYLDCKGEIVTFDSNLEKTRTFVDTYFSGNGIKFAQKYYESVALLPTVKQFDIVGHFDLVAKNNEMGHFFDATSKEYLDFGRDAIHTLKGKIPLFEVNTGAISRGYRSVPYPQMEFLKEFKRCGFGAIITSDCHNKAFIDNYFQESRELLKAAGFTSRWILTEEGFQEVSL